VIGWEFPLAKNSTAHSSPLDDPCVPLLLELAPAAAGMDHGGRSFIDHLIGTWWILNQWKQPRFICRAGLLHSCYSTSFYPHALFSLRERTLVRALIGARAEALAYRFCIIDRAELWAKVATVASLPQTLSIARTDRDGCVALSKQTVQELLLVECANVAEQSAGADGSPAEWMARVISWSRLLPASTLPLQFGANLSLTFAAERKALRLYHSISSAPLRTVPSLLDEAIALNPCAGEPKLLRALHFLEQHDKERAFSDAMQGHSLLSAWSVAWDKRWSLNRWLSLGTAILNSIVALNGRNDNLTLKTVRKALTT
jgi:hypothetical protein